MTFKEAETNAKKQYGNPSNGFTIAKRTPGEVTSFVKGDSFQIPNELKVYTNNINGNKAEFILVDVTNNKKKSVKQFYPSLLWRMREVYNKDNEPTGEWVYSSGSAVDELKKYDDVNSAMLAWAGRTITFSDMTKIRTNRFGSNEVKWDTIPVIDID